MLLVYRGSHAHYPFLVFFSDFVVFWGLGGLQPQKNFAGDPLISSEMALVKKTCNKIKVFLEKKCPHIFLYN